MNEKIQKLSASFRGKLEQIKKDPTVAIRLRSDNEKLFHSYPIRCEGYPTSGNVKGEFKWYRINNVKEDIDSTNNFQIISSTNQPTFHSNIEDGNSEIACQWVPDDDSVVSYQPSNFARIGPLVKDPTILSDAQAMIDANIAWFKVDLSNSNVEQSTKLLKVDCKTAMVKIIETGEKKVDNELLHTLSYSDGSSPVPMNQSNTLTPSPSSPQTPSKIPSTEPALSISDETCNEPTADHAIPDATAVPITPTATNTLENKNESHLAVNTEKNDKPKNISSTIPVNIQIRIKFDFQIQLSRKNIQELSILKQSDKTTVQLLTVFLQTPRERDVLCTLLTALINKKKR